MKVWKDLEFTKRNRGLMGIMGSIAALVGVGCAVVGIISEATITLIGLYPISWELLSIASLVFSLGCWLGWAVGIHLQAREKETEAKDQSIPI